MNKESESEKIKTFTDLMAWQKGHCLVLETYKLTQHFPKEESFGLTSQMRRSAISITSNLAEGFGRYSYKEKAQFYSIAQGSTAELRSQFLVSKDVGLLDPEQYDRLSQAGLEVSRLIAGLIKSSHSRSKANFGLLPLSDSDSKF